MRWLPSWLGNSFSSLFKEFREEIFTFDDAVGTLRKRPQQTLLTLSLLRRHGYMVVFARDGRKRLYRLCDPGPLTVALALGADFDLKQGRYRNLVLKTLFDLFYSYRDDLSSLIVFGSVARGTASSSSDVDMLVVGGFEKPFIARIDELGELEHSGLIKEELGWLKARDIHTHISWYPLTRTEVSAFRPLYLDMVDEVAIVYDRDDLFRSVLTSLRARLDRMGSKRVWMEKGRWYWVLDPSIKPEEALTLEEVRPGVHARSR